MKGLPFAQLVVAVGMLLAIAQTVLQVCGQGSPLGMKAALVITVLGTLKHVVLTLWPNGTGFLAMIRDQAERDQQALAPIVQVAQPVAQLAQQAAPAIHLHVMTTGPQPIATAAGTAPWAVPAGAPGSAADTASIVKTPAVT